METPRRREKSTLKIDDDELARLKKPEERPTSAMDPAELKGLLHAVGAVASPEPQPQRFPRASTGQTTLEAAGASTGAGLPVLIASSIAIVVAVALVAILSLR